MNSDSSGKANGPLFWMTRLLQRRLIAALLPFSFVWSFVACVSICERETLANHSAAHSTSTSEIRSASESDGCPLSYFPRAVTPERVKSDFALTPLPSFAAATLSIHSSHPEL